MERSSWQAVFWRVQAPCRHAAGLTEARTPPSLARMEMPSSRSKATGPEMLAGEVVVVLEDDELVRRATERQIGRAHVRTPVTNANLVCRLLIEKKKQTHQKS